MAAQMQQLQFNLKLIARQFQKDAQKCEKEEKSERDKCLAYMKKQNPDCARVYAESAVRKRTEGINYLRLSSRLEAVSSRISTAIKMRQVTASMGQLSTAMESAMKSMQPEHIMRVVSDFEKQFSNADVTADVMQTTMGEALGSSTPQDQVQQLMAQIADENQLDLQHVLNSERLQPGTASQVTASSTGVEDLEARLNALR